MQNNIPGKVTNSSQLFETIETSTNTWMDKQLPAYLHNEVIASRKRQTQALGHSEGFAVNESRWTDRTFHKAVYLKLRKHDLICSDRKWIDSGLQSCTDCTKVSWVLCQRFEIHVMEGSSKIYGKWVFSMTIHSFMFLQQNKFTFAL